MSDLISRNEVIDIFQQKADENSGLIRNNMLFAKKLIESIPTAYDVDKVVEELEEVINNLECNLIGDCENDILNVVKRGGKDE